MNIVQAMAEQHIEEAIAAGALKGLEGEGRPLALEGDDPFVPASLRMA